MFKGHIGTIKVQLLNQFFSCLAVSGNQYIVNSFFYLGNLFFATAILGQIIIGYSFADWLEEIKRHPRVDL